jgi:type II secretory pathway pseudopilin PulG
MAVRLQMNVGLVAGERRLPDSADTISIVEPVIGSTSRTKGSLYLLVTGRGGRRLRDATKLVAERVRDDYYYDLSAGISVCLRKAVTTANKILTHSPDRPVIGPGETPPIGIALAVVRGNELYVATLGPAEAYLIRQARLLTLPDTNPESGLPAEQLDGPEVWHGEIAMGDCLVLVSPNVTNRIGLGPLQDTVGQLHPQAAVDQIQRQFGSGGLGATGGDGILIVEATEVASTHRASPLKPVWPDDALAGSPERSPIPLADAVSESVTTVQSTAHQAQVVADGWLRRGVYSLFDRMPERPVRRGRVTPMVVRRERQQRAAFAVLGILAVIAIVGSVMWFFAGPSQSNKVATQVTAQQAFEQAQTDIFRVYGNGRDLVKTEPKTAYGYLKDAYSNLQIARANGYTDARVSALIDQTVNGLDDYYGITIIQPQVVASWATDELTGAVLGPDGAAYVIDATLGTVYRVDLGSGTKLPVMTGSSATPASSPPAARTC